MVYVTAYRLKKTRGRRIPADDLTTRWQRAPKRGRFKRRNVVKLRRKNAAQDGYLSRKPPMIPRQSSYGTRLLKSDKEKELTVALKQYFGVRRLSAIKAKDVCLTVNGEARKMCGPTYINMEIGCLRRVLKRVGLWHLIGDNIKPLREPQSIGRALTFDERTSYFE